MEPVIRRKPWDGTLFGQAGLKLWPAANQIAAIICNFLLPLKSLQAPSAVCKLSATFPEVARRTKPPSHDDA